MFSLGKHLLYKRFLTLTFRFLGSELKDVEEGIVSKNDVQKRPLKPMNPYIAFLYVKRPEIIKSNPDLKYNDVLRVVGELWANLSNEEKKIFNDKFEKENEEFKKQTEIWWNHLSSEDKNDVMQLKDTKSKRRSRKTYFNKLQDLGRPLRPLSAINYFVSDQFKSLRLCNDNQKVKTFASIAEDWKKMNEKERKPYNELARVDFERFSKEKLVWELKMMREGKGHLIKMYELKTKVVRKKNVK